VLDEKMGEEVKITVIATGFRDQMPERRARMLSVEEAPVVSVPLVSVPLQAPDNWLNEEAAALPPSPPRFKSQDEDEEAEAAEADGAFFFSSSRPAVATTVTVAPAVAAVAGDMEFVMEREAMAVPARPQFDELAGESGSVPPPRDYAADFSQGVSVEAGQEEHSGQPVASLFQEGSEEHQRDLDVPAFLRRLQF
jgi:cell division protein FtsZ